MKKDYPVLLAAIALALASLACAVLGRDASLENLRMAYDEAGEDVTSTFSPTDIFYAVVDLHDAREDTEIKAVWTAVDVIDVDAGYEFQQQTLDIRDEPYSGPIYFQLSNDDVWPTGLYRVDLYVDETLTQSLEFKVEAPSTVGD